MKQGIINGVHNGIIPQYNKIVTRGSIVAANNRIQPVSGMLQWLRADQRITYNGINASIWGDLSGYGYNIAQGSASKQPVPTNNIINGHPAMYFDGGDSMYCSFLGPISQPVTVFVVWNTLTAATQFAFDGITSGNRMALYTYNGIQMYSGYPEIMYPKTIPFTFMISTSIFNGASSYNYENGILKVSGTVGSNNLTGIMMGAQYDGISYYLTGYIAEIIIYNRLLTPIELLQNYTYLKQRYGL